MLQDTFLNTEDFSPIYFVNTYFRLHDGAYNIKISFFITVFSGMFDYGTQSSNLIGVSYGSSIGNIKTVFLQDGNQTLEQMHLTIALLY